jgi:hypothetical protein
MNRNTNNLARFVVLTVVLVKIQVSWDVMWCDWASSCRRHPHLFTTTTTKYGQSVLLTIKETSFNVKFFCSENTCTATY